MALKSNLANSWDTRVETYMVILEASGRGTWSELHYTSTFNGCEPDDEFSRSTTFIVKLKNWWNVFVSQRILQGVNPSVDFFAICSPLLHPSWPVKWQLHNKRYRFCPHRIQLTGTSMQQRKKACQFSLRSPLVSSELLRLQRTPFLMCSNMVNLGRKVSDAPNCPHQAHLKLQIEQFAVDLMRRHTSKNRKSKVACLLKSRRKKEMQLSSFSCLH
jgi:hypothetical protein